MSDYTVREAGINDLDACCAVSLPFFEEGAYKNLTFDVTRSIETLTVMLTHVGYHIIIAEDSRGVPVGIYAFALERQFTKEKVGMCVLFYVVSEHRSGGVAKLLVKKCNEFCDNNNVGMFFTSSTAGFSDGGVNERAFTILMKRHGFKEDGRFLRREYNE